MHYRKKSLDIICATAVKGRTTLHVNGNASAFAGALLSNGVPVVWLSHS
jgi:hypothetical protein